MAKTTDPKHQALLTAARAVVEDATLLDGYVTYGMIVDPQLIDHLRAAVEDSDDSQTRQMCALTNPNAPDYVRKFRRFWGVENLTEDEYNAWLDCELAGHAEAADLVDEGQTTTSTEG